MKAAPDALPAATTRAMRHPAAKSSATRIDNENASNNASDRDRLIWRELPDTCADTEIFFLLLVAARRRGPAVSYL
jgi:hypothetical protein